MMSKDTDMTVTDEERELLEGWTEVDRDLGDCRADIAKTVLGSRLTFGRMDAPRSRHWQVPEGVDCFNDIAYVDDGLRAHKLDL
ncbi:MAG: alpha/beta hydrolase, partial [Bifidobacteriales bacterium]|nr:alpha/beta hydrolase [Bifidobacteriales bacterium]